MIIDKNFLLQKIESYANMESRGKPLKTANLMEIIIATDCKTGDYFFMEMVILTLPIVIVILTILPPSFIQNPF